MAETDGQVPDTEGEMSPELAEVMTGACYCLALRRASRRMFRLYDSALAAQGLTITQYSTLVWIKAMRRPTVQKIADRMELDQSALSRGLAPLERQGLIASDPHPDDGRKRVLRLTPAGARKLEAGAKAWKAAQTEVDRSAPDGVMPGLMAALETLAPGR